MSARQAQILIVDDKETMLSLLAKILSDQHDVTSAANGQQALDLIAAREFDVVLTDVRMPGADGFEVIRAVKRQWPATEVVMMTAYASIESAVEAIRRGAYDYLQKPFDPDDVSLIVARAFERKRQRAGGDDGLTQPGGQSVGELASAGTARPGVGDEPVAAAPEVEQPGVAPLASLSYKAAVNLARDRISHEYLAALLTTFRGNVTQAAERAGIERESLHRLLKRYGLRAESFRDD
jgi:DNA-binding NtrC family response regulator